VGVPEQKGTGVRILTADRARQRPERRGLCGSEQVKGRVVVDDLTGLDESVLLGLHATDPEEAARVVEERGASPLTSIAYVTSALWTPAAL